MSNKRVVIKISGEVFEVGNQPANLDFPSIKKVAESLKKVVKAGYQVGVVVGAGNIFRARMVKGSEVDRVAADHMGMMATSINALALQATLERVGQEARVLSSFSVPAIMEDYVYKRAINHLKNKRVVIFAGGTGNPYFTTDTTLVLRALEVGATNIYKASNVSGVYDSDPDKNKKAKLYKKISYAEALKRNLKIMDATAFALANDNKLNLTVFKYSPENIVRAVVKNNIGTKVTNESR
ncbi:MAG: UMP kinase [Candidatus Komeilibacteria bacterium RIFOXYC1_FULL_37_11]|uniref:Uridylate kinase n=1 Tax=Candidatus Komeilibacteria bacterium RIFOXYC1_FULL_37_11 TaxID=1798555 RepID=A0A1G2BXS7_9BACT|nr:MAG: UMP kinase [Candidatus Komeilibacteria bacterium RIFOXYC1_FULL_37_11]OGY95810.1 MAG: UMP kinase [Candidatus Komeilibacteria bacterium RIFOXYD1_FULL_37_29]